MTFQACSGSDAYTHTVKRLRIEDAQAASRPVVVDVLREPGIGAPRPGRPRAKRTGKSSQRRTARSSFEVRRRALCGFRFTKSGDGAGGSGVLAFSLAAGGNS